MRTLLLFCLALACFAGSSCNTIEYYEKEKLNSPVMDMGIRPGLESAEQKIFYATEGAAGGLGSSAGGGCGCN